MNKELQEKLYEKYPSLFGQKDLPMTQTAMCWGIDTGDGWYNIMDCLCRSISEHIKSLEEKRKRAGEPLPPESEIIEIQFVQVKEKFGALRAYINCSDEVIDAFIEMAERLSACTCENCGTPAKIASYRGWYRALCPTCSEEYSEKSGYKIDPPDEDEEHGS